MPPRGEGRAAVHEGLPGVLCGRPRGEIELDLGPPDGIPERGKQPNMDSHTDISHEPARESMGGRLLARPAQAAYPASQQKDGE